MVGFPATEDRGVLGKEEAGWAATAEVEDFVEVSFMELARWGCFLESRSLRLNMPEMRFLREGDLAFSFLGGLVLVDVDVDVVVGATLPGVEVDVVVVLVLVAVEVAVVPVLAAVVEVEAEGVLVVPEGAFNCTSMECPRIFWLCCWRIRSCSMAI